MITRKKLRGCWRSWTIRINAAFALLAGAVPMLQDTLPQLQPYLGAETYRYAMGMVVFANILLRFKTSSGLDTQP